MFIRVISARIEFVRGFTRIRRNFAEKKFCISSHEKLAGWEIKKFFIVNILVHPSNQRTVVICARLSLGGIHSRLAECIRKISHAHLDNFRIMTYVTRVRNLTIPAFLYLSRGHNSSFVSSVGQLIVRSLLYTDGRATP